MNGTLRIALLQKAHDSCVFSSTFNERRSCAFPKRDAVLASALWPDKNIVFIPGLSYDITGWDDNSSTLGLVNHKLADITQFWYNLNEERSKYLPNFIGPTHFTSYGVIYSKRMGAQATLDASLFVKPSMAMILAAGILLRLALLFCSLTKKQSNATKNSALFFCFVLEKIVLELCGNYLTLIFNATPRGFLFFIFCIFFIFCGAQHRLEPLEINNRCDLNFQDPY